MLKSISTNLKTLLFIGLLALSSFAQADSVGLNYSATQDAGRGAVSKGAWEFLGSHDLDESLSLTGKAILKNGHDNTGLGVGAEVGGKYKFGDTKAHAVAWVQPAVTYTHTSLGNTYLGYVVDAGVDVKVADLLVTPAVSYGNAFDSTKAEQKTAGVKVAYQLDKNWSVDARYRREYNEVGADANRVYVGTAYKF